VPGDVEEGRAAGEEVQSRASVCPVPVNGSPAEEGIRVAGRRGGAGGGMVGEDQEGVGLVMGAASCFFLIVTIASHFPITVFGN
jgi:hypothetical protein